jgi:MarR family transcriptional regulator, lower aerobic nicotinate degradation pathway regulator
MRSTPSPRAARAPASASLRTAKPPWHGIPTAIARRFHQVCVAKTSELVSPAGLTPLQYGAMLHLSKTTGLPGIEQNSLAERINVDRNTASLLVEQLVKKGLLERQVNGADRRSRLLSLTAKGKALYSQLRPAHAALNRDLLAPITPQEQKLLMDMLIRVVEGNLIKETRNVNKGIRRIRRQNANT